MIEIKEENDKMDKTIGIKETAFKEVRGLKIKGFKVNECYPLLGISNRMLLIYNPENGEIIELFPKYCLVKY